VVVVEGSGDGAGSIALLPAGLKLEFASVKSPVQPENVYPGADKASSPVVIAAGIVTEQDVPAVPQLMPAPFTIPPPGRETVNWWTTVPTVMLVEAVAVL
jgi:hypothetical protein